MNDNINTALCRDFTSRSEVVVNNLTDFNGHGTTRDVIEGRLNAEKAVKNALLHTYTYSYTSTNMAYHTCTCTCGYTFTENHEWYLINPSATLPRYACRYCQAITTLPPVVENGIIDEEDKI